jgi:hypothetical protein
MGLTNHSRLLMGLYCDRKGTPRIIGLSRPIVQIDGEACYTAVGSSYPGRAQAAKGAGVHMLKGIVSWVKIVVRQIV